MGKAIFFDKDGVLNKDNGNYGNLNLETKYIFDDVGHLISKCREKNYKIFIVTNQPIVARGIIKEKELINKLALFEKYILNQNKNAIIDRIIYCPHHPNADEFKYKKICNCRKPKPGMLLKLKKQFNIDMGNSFVLGDRISDIMAGYLAGCKTIQLINENFESDLIVTDLKINYEISPDFKINKLLDILDLI